MDDLHVIASPAMISSPLPFFFPTTTKLSGVSMLCARQSYNVVSNRKIVAQHIFRNNCNKREENTKKNEKRTEKGSPTAIITLYRHCNNFCCIAGIWPFIFSSWPFETVFHKKGYKIFGNSVHAIRDLWKIYLIMV